MSINQLSLCSVYVCVEVSQLSGILSMESTKLYRCSDLILVIRNDHEIVCNVATPENASKIVPIIISTARLNLCFDINHTYNMNWHIAADMEW